MACQHIIATNEDNKGVLKPSHSHLYAKRQLADAVVLMYSFELMANGMGFRGSRYGN